MSHPGPAAPLRMKNTMGGRLAAHHPRSRRSNDAQAAPSPHPRRGRRPDARLRRHGGDRRPGASVAIPAPAPAAGTQQVTLTVGSAMQFAPSSLVVRAGQPVELTLRNGGGIAHDFTLAEGASRPVKIEAQAGQTARGTFTIDSPGTYAFVCSVPGHAAAGMRGTITAQ